MKNAVFEKVDFAHFTAHFYGIFVLSKEFFFGVLLKYIKFLLLKK